MAWVDWFHFYNYLIILAVETRCMQNFRTMRSTSHHANNNELAHPYHWTLWKNSAWPHQVMIFFPSVMLALCALKGLRACNCLLSLAPSLKGIKILWYRSFRTTTLFGQAFCQTLYQLLVSPMNRNIVKGSDGSITTIREEKYDFSSFIKKYFFRIPISCWSDYSIKNAISPKI